MVTHKAWEKNLLIKYLCPRDFRRGEMEEKMKILLCCNAGMSSSILVKKIRDVAEKTGEDIEVSAVANASIKNEVGKWDVCLVGPQLVFAVDSIHQQLNIPVASIEPRVYAMADGAAAIEMAKKLLG